MSIAVDPDGSFWLFGKGGLAWRFDSSGTLTFATEKEPRPRKPTAQEVMQKETEARMARAMAEHREMQELANEREEAEHERRRRIGLFLLMGIVVLMMVFFVYLMSLRL